MAATERLPPSYRYGIMDSLLIELAILYEIVGRQSDAEALFKRALSIREEYCDPYHPDIAKTLSLLGRLYFARGTYDEAEPLFARALSIIELEGEPDSRDLACALNNLGRLYYDQGRYEESASLLNRSVTILSKGDVQGEGDLAAALNNFASLRQAQGLYDEAELLFKRSVSVLEASKKPEATQIAAAINNLAVLFHSRGKLILAEQFYKRSLAQKLGDENALSEARTLRNLGALYQELGRQDEAKAAIVRAQSLEQWDVIDIPIMVATNRRVETTPTGPIFGPAEETDPRHTCYAIGLVHAPKEEVTNRSNRLAEANGQLHLATGRQTYASTLEIGVVGQVKSAETIMHALRHQASRAIRFPNQVLIAIHGYNNSFASALRRVAMIVFDLDFDGAVLLFSWPSQATLFGYNIDRKFARTASPFLAQLISSICKELPELRVNVLAHSTGAELALSALVETANDIGQSPKLHFGELIFAHADMDPNRLEKHMPDLRKLKIGVTSYSSTEDWAMTISRLVQFKSARVGSHAVNIPGVDSVDITGLGEGPLAVNHTVFVHSPIVFGDIARLIATGQRPPSKRTRWFEEVRMGPRVYWQYHIPKGSS